MTYPRLPGSAFAGRSAEEVYAVAEEELNAELKDVVGRRITAVEVGEYPVLHLDDGRALRFEGGGYDGLWREVYVEIKKPDAK